MCFFNILHIISSIPPSANSKPETCSIPGDDPLGSSPSANKGIGIDLNMGLRSAADSGESESFGDNGSDSSAIQGNRVGGGGEGAEEVRDKSVEISEATDAQVQRFHGVEVDHEEEEKSEEEISVESERDRKGNDGAGGETVPFAAKRHEGKGSDNNCLDLLIEAAKLVSAEDESNSEEPSGLSRELRSGNKKRKERWVVADLCSEMAEKSPVVRSKRGRTQALPYRFRDSVVEPLKRSGRSRSHRPSTTATRKRLIGS